MFYVLYPFVTYLLTLPRIIHFVFSYCVTGNSVVCMSPFNDFIGTKLEDG
jgi:hypothetical protein